MKRIVTNLVVVLAILLVCPVLFGNCSREKSKNKDQPASSLTESQRDSAIADSKLPGAKAVGRALELADTAKARAKRLDDEQPQGN